MRTKISYRIAFLILFFSPLIFLTVGYSQERVPRDYDPEEFITLNREISIDDALEIINQFSQKYEKRIIVDPVERSKEIGVVVENMHWKRALEYILRSNMLRYEEFDRYYEITGLKDKNKNRELENKIKLTTREVDIKAVFFEADQQILSEVGIDWSTLKDGKVKFRIDSDAASEVTQNVFSAQGNITAGSFNVFALMKTFESLNKGQVIATPQIRIMEGEEGKIKVGKNFFLTTRDFAGNTRYSEYESGTILNVIPQIITENEITFIHLDISAEKSDVIPGAINVTKKITEGRTQVLMINGEETAIAGLISNEVTAVRKGVPLLKDLPWWFFGVRYLFGYNSNQVTKKELIILIQAEIVSSIVDRMKHRILRYDYLKKRRKEFDERMKELKKEN